VAIGYIYIASTAAERAQPRCRISPSPASQQTQRPRGSQCKRAQVDLRPTSRARYLCGCWPIRPPLSLAVQTSRDAAWGGCKRGSNMLRAVLDEGMALGAPSLLPQEDARPPAKRTRQDTLTEARAAETSVRLRRLRRPRLRLRATRTISADRGVMSERRCSPMPSIIWWLYNTAAVPGALEPSAEVRLVVESASSRCQSPATGGGERAALHVAVSEAKP
jgi:hypothetical protein